MKKENLEILFSADAIAERIKRIGEEINREFIGQELVLICVLKGAFMFFSDLVKHITVQPQLDFVRVASYSNNTSSSKTVSFTKDVEISLQGKHVILVEDVVDTGHTMHFLVQQMRARDVASLKIAALLDKTERREVNVQVDYVGFSVQKGFVVGYGLDHAELYRELPAIYIAHV